MSHRRAGCCPTRRTGDQGLQVGAALQAGGSALGRDWINTAFRHRRSVRGAGGPFRGSAFTLPVTCPGNIAAGGCGLLLRKRRTRNEYGA